MRPTYLKRFVLVTSWALLAIFSLTTEAVSICPAGIPETATSNDFQIIDEGEILHVPSQLVFMRCSLGQTWDGRECVGEAKVFTWQQALAASRGFEFNSIQTWRLPNIKQLSVITERACVRPAINQDIFPQTPADEFWTSTPSVIDATRVWAIAFSNATSSIKAKDRSLYVRLVRPYQQSN